MTLLKVVVGGLGLYFLGVGSVCMFMPELMAGQFNISPLNADGFSTIRGDLGGMFLGLAIMSFIGLRWPVMLYAPGILLGAIAFGRIWGFIFDGATFFTVMLCLIEVVLMVFFLAIAQRMQDSFRSTSATS